MPDRSVSVRLQMEVAGYITNARQAAGATRSLATEAKTMAATHKQAMTDIGRMSAAAGAAVVAGMGLATRAAINWETAWAGVTKTVDGTTGQMQQLENGLRGLATTLPATHEEIAGVAEAAGQLGVQRSAILGFTKTMIDLGETTNLSADEAATAIAQMTNVMQTAPKDVGRLGATLVALGNDGASTERQIIEMSQRIAGAAAVVGLSEGEVLAFANTVASMGIDVEAGGSSVSRVLTDMSKAAQSGGKELDVFAKTAGMSAEQFSVAFQTAPAEAFTSFIEGLGGVRKAGGNVFAILDQIGLSDVRVSQALLGMASSGDLLRDSLLLQAKAWRENTALTDEAAKRYDTDAARIQVSMNKINDAAIDVGATLAPAVASGAEKVGSLASAFAGLPGPVQKSVTAVTAVGGAAALTGGAMLILVPKIVETRKAIDALNLSSAASAARLGALAKAGVAVAAVTATVGTLNALYDGIQGLSPATDELALSLERLGRTGKASGAAAKLLGSDLAGLGSVMSTLRSERSTLREIWDFGAVFSPGDSQWGEATKRVEALDAALSTMAASGNAAGAARAFQQIGAAAKEEGVSVKRLAELFPQYTSAAGATESVNDSLAASYSSVVAPAVEDAEAALRGYTDALGDTAAIDAYTATAQLSRSFRDLSVEIKTAGRVTDDEKVAIGGFASDVRSTAGAILEQTGSQKKANAAMSEGRKKFIDLAVQAGYTRDEARKLADTLLDIPARTDVNIVAHGLDPVVAKIAELRRQAGIPIEVTVNTINRLNQLPGGPRLGRAAGGWVPGPPSTSDTVPAWLSTGEYVVRSAAVAKYGTHHFDELNAMRFAGGGSPGDKGAAARAAVAATRTARDVGAIGRATPPTDTLAEIEAAIRAVDRLTAAYDEQQAVVGMSAAERRRYHAEQRTAAVVEHLAARRDAAQKRDEAKAEIADNQAAWKFDHLTEEQQLAALDKKIKGEKKYSAQWMADSRQREQIAGSIAGKEKARLESIRSELVAAVAERDARIAAVTSSFTTFGGIGGTGNVAAGAGEVTGAQAGGTDVMTGQLIARSGQARLEQARTFVANLRALRSAGLNAASLQEILGMGPGGGAAYAAALAADVSVIAGINATQGQFAALGQGIGAEFAGPVRFAAFSPAQQPTTFNIFDANGVLMGTMYGAADQVAGQIASAGWYGRG